MFIYIGKIHYISISLVPSVYFCILFLNVCVSVCHVWVFAMCGYLQRPEERIKPQEQELETGGCETSNWVLGRRTRSSGRAEVLVSTQLWFKHVSYLIALFSLLFVLALE